MAVDATKASESAAAAAAPSKRPQSEDHQKRASSFFQRSPSTLSTLWCHGGTSPVNFRLPMKRELPLAERPHLLNPRASKRSMFGFNHRAGDGEAANELDSSRPSKKHKRSLLCHSHLSAFQSTVPGSTAAGPHSGAADQQSAGLQISTDQADSGSPRTCAPAELLERWETTIRRLADTFLSDVGEEKESCLPHMAGFLMKQKLFKERASTLKESLRQRDMTVEVNRETVLSDLFATLDKESEKRSQERVPAACKQLKASFKGEKGEGDGVTRGLLAAASSKIALGDGGLASSDEAGTPRPYFHSPGKAGFYAPTQSSSWSESRRRYYTNVGRLIGLSLLHNLPISLALTRPTIKYLLGRTINWTDRQTPHHHHHHHRHHLSSLPLVLSLSHLSLFCQL